MPQHKLRTQPGKNTPFPRRSNNKWNYKVVLHKQRTFKIHPLRIRVLYPNAHLKVWNYSYIRVSNILLSGVSFWLLGKCFYLFLKSGGQLARGIYSNDVRNRLFWFGRIFSLSGILFWFRQLFRSGLIPLGTLSFCSHILWIGFSPALLVVQRWKRLSSRHVINSTRPCAIPCCIAMVALIFDLLTDP